jgi:hypothetical protein
MACVNQTWPHCVNQMGKTQSKHLVERHGRGTAWARHGMCESALRVRLVEYQHVSSEKYLQWKKALRQPDGRLK